MARPYERYDPYHRQYPGKVWQLVAVPAYRDEVDAALSLAEVVGYRTQNNYRILRRTAASNPCPWYVWDVPKGHPPKDLVGTEKWQARL